MNVNIIYMLFFAFLVSVIPTSFAEEENVWIWASANSDYFIHFQAQVRDIDGSLVSVIETFNGEYRSDSMTELVYSQLSLKQVVEISNKKYEVRQLVELHTVQSSGQVGAYNIGFEIDGQYIAVFHAYPPMFLVENNDMITIQWMIFKKI